MTGQSGRMREHDETTVARAGKPVRRLLGMVALFALVGPPVGGLVVSAFLAVLAAIPQLMALELLEALTIVVTATLFGTMFGLPIAYFTGVLPAAGIGLAVALWDRHKGLISWRIAFGAALVSWLLVAMGADGLVETDEGTRIWQVSLLLAHLAATAVCWWLARSFFDRPVTTQPAGS